MVEECQSAWYGGILCGGELIRTCDCVASEDGCCRLLAEGSTDVEGATETIFSKRVLSERKAARAQQL